MSKLVHIRMYKPFEPNPDPGYTICGYNICEETKLLHKDERTKATCKKCLAGCVILAVDNKYYDLTGLPAI